MRLNLKKALLIVDVQNDFTPKGGLAVPDGDKVIPKINKYIKIFAQKNLPIFATRDWHPKKTAHFKKYGGAWPVHCVQGTKGAEFHKGLKLPKQAIIMSKGIDPQKDSYSAFDSFDENNVPLGSLLKIFGIKELYIAGLTTDYCVKFSTIDALKAGFEVYVLTDAIKGVDTKPGDSQKALEEMFSHGAKKMILDKLL